MTARIFAKLIIAVFCVLGVALVVVDLLASRVASDSYIQTLRENLGGRGRTVAHLMGKELEKLEGPRLQQLAQVVGARVTLVAQDGRVLVDSDARAEKMENHRNRPELKAAWAGREGSTIRLSPTVGIPFLYVAVPTQGGALRLAVPLRAIDQEVDRIRRQMLMVTLLAFLPAILVAGLMAHFYSSRLGAIIDHAGRLASGDFRTRQERRARGELGELTSKLNETGAKLQKVVEELQREHTELEKLERIRKDFVINVSHELRTPLASIQGYTETLLDGALHEPEHNVRFLTIIRQNAERLGRLIADLLTLSRVELKTQKFQFAAYYVNGLLEEGVASMRPLAEKKNISITLEPAPGETEIFCDSEAVQQILGNLLDNAVKYTPEGGSIVVGARPVPAAAGGPEMVEIWVRDTGIGIPAEDLPRLFERFYRVDKARSRELGGTGLGLSIVKHLVRAQGGEVRVASTPGLGSTFLVSLPVHDLGLAESGAVQTELTVS